MSVLKRLQTNADARTQKSKRPSNLLILVEGYEGKAEKSVLIGKESKTGKDVRISLRDELSPGENQRPTIESMMDKNYEHRVEVGGIVMAEACFQSNSDGSELSSSWFSTYQHKSSKDAQKWLMEPPENRNAKDNIRMALSGHCNITMVESRQYQDSSGADITTKARILVDVYSTQKAKAQEISSTAEMESFIADAISPKNKLVESDTAAVIRYLDKESNTSFIIGVPSSRTVVVNNEYVKEDPFLTASNYVEAALKSPDSAMSALAQSFNDGEALNIEYVPASRFTVVGKSLSNLKVFDREGKIIKSADGAKTITQGERLQRMYRADAEGQKQIRLLETNLYAIFYGDSNKPIVGGFTSVGGYTKGYTLDKLPTDNFTPTPEVKKAYNKTQDQAAKPESTESTKSTEPAKSTAPLKTAPEVSQTKEESDEMEEMDFDALNSALDDIDMPGLTS